MSQMGMQMPGGMRVRRGSSPDVYTALAAVACVCLGTAIAFVYQGASKVGKDGSALGMQEAHKIVLKKADGK